MKKIAFLIIISSIFLFSACSEYEIIDSKPGESIDPVTNLNHSISGSQASITWDLPSSYPNDVIEPVSVYIIIKRNGQNAGTRTLDNAPESFTYDGYDPSSTYKFTVKVKAAIQVESKNFSNLRYSPGVTIEF